MSMPMLVLSLLSFSALCTSIGALFVTLRMSDRSLSKRVGELSLSLSLLHESHERLTEAIRTLRSRLNMTAKRERDTVKIPEPIEPPDDVADALAWKRDMNRRLAMGERIPPKKGTT